MHGSTLSSADPLVHIVDDDVGVRAAAREFLVRSGYQVECYEGPEEFLASFRSRPPQCFLLDVFLPGISGLELQRRLLERSPEFSILLMTGGASTQMVVRAFREGAVDFLEKPWRPEELLDAVGRAIQRDRARNLEALAHERCGEPFAGLSPREREVLALIVQGNSSKSAAKTLHVSKSTVDFHRASLMRKLGAHSVMDLVRLAMLEDSIHPTPPATQPPAAHRLGT